MAFWSIVGGLGKDVVTAETTPGGSYIEMQYYPLAPWHVAQLNGTWLNVTKVWGKVGYSLEICGGLQPTGYIEMSSERPTPNHVAQANGTWALPATYWDDQKATKKAELAEACHNAIISAPVTSSALGTSHTYDCRNEDQLNAHMAYTEANVNTSSVNIMANDGTSFAMRAHTAAQAAQVITAMNGHVRTQRATLATKYGQVDAIDPTDPQYADDAAIQAAIDAITW